LTNLVEGEMDFLNYEGDEKVGGAYK